MNRLTTALTFCMALCLLASGVDAAQGDTHTDAESAGIDYRLQGEFAGKLDIGDGEMPFGAQVIALGDGKFRLVGYHGGLPGAGWQSADGVVREEGQRVDDQVTFELDGARVVATEGNLEVFVDGQSQGGLEKVERKSPSLGAKPPAEAKVLFDGTSTEHFEDGKMVEGKYLAATNCASHEKFGDHRLHIEFRTPFMPAARGQARGNSGVYVQSRYEVQVLDSFGLEGKDNECGGIYSVSPPAVNMCFPPLAWQTYDIDFTAARYNAAGEKTANARITVKHNGVTIHDDRELLHGTPGRHAEGPEPDSLFLQNHGNPVVFRNIWVVTP